jgi:hypothetical protein
MVGAVRSRPLTVRLFDAGSEHDDGRVALLADGASHVQAVHVGQHEVQQHQARFIVAKGGQRLATVVGHRHAVSGLLQVVSHEVGDLGLVVHDEDRSTHDGLSFVSLPQCYPILSFLSIAFTILS